MEWTVGECSCVTKTRRKTRDCSQKNEDGEDVCEGEARIDEECEVPDESNVCRESASTIIYYLIINTWYLSAMG